MVVLDMGYRSTVNLLLDDREAKDSRLQKVYDTIKGERPWDIRPGSTIYTTTKEKYMIKLIIDGYDIPDETIRHVVKRCFAVPHPLPDGEYSCWFGFLQTNEEFRCHDYIRCIQNNLQHQLNDHLQCYHGALYCPTDMLTNPFGSWQPKTGTPETGFQGVNEMGTPETVLHEVNEKVKKKWPKNWYDDELPKYTLKYLIKLIKEGEFISSEVMQHVVDGCFRGNHRIDSDYLCCYGFILKIDELHDFSNCTSAHDINETLQCDRGVLKYIMNGKFYQNTGIRSIPVNELRYRKYLTSQHCLAENVRSLNMQRIGRVWERIKYKDLISPFFEHRTCTTWQERHLISLLTNGDNIPNEIITHALEGCYTWGHLLNDKYGCCRGYILDKDTFLRHNYSRCRMDHQLTETLKCFRGKVYHRNDEIPMGSIF